jgi:hypothetical protein
VARWLLPTLIVVATALFVIGVAIERNSGDVHAEEATPFVAEAQESDTEHSEGEAGPSEDKDAVAEAGSHDESEDSGEEELLGLDVESTPLVALAAAVSLALALAISLRPGWLPLLVLIVVAMALFAALDVREVFHQLDEDKTGLATLAALVAALHLAAAGLAGTRTQRAAKHG